MARRRLRRIAKRAGVGLAVLLLVGVVSYLLIPEREIMEFAWRQARGTRYEHRVSVWCLTKSNDPIERALADGRIRHSEPIEAVLQIDRSLDVIAVGRYHVIKEARPEGTISFGGWTIVAKDGELASATAWSCTYQVDFFDTLTEGEQDECAQLYLAERDRRHQARKDARMAVAGFGATFDPRYLPPPDPGPEN